jgi:uncharacterized DUF497 family protein
MNYNVTTYRYEWDDRKDHANRKKHGVSFSLASTVFQDPLHLSIPDCGHENRWVTIGRTPNQETLVVVHADNASHPGETIRIISARRANKREQVEYEEGL